MKKNLTLIAFILLLFGSFLLINFGGSLLFNDRYLDFSGQDSYTLSPASRRLLSSLNKKYTIRLYVSSRLNDYFPRTGQYARYVTERLKQYQNYSNGVVSLDIIRVEPYSAAEKNAEKYGIKTFLSNDGKINLMFGAVILNDEGKSITIPNFVELRRRYFENDITNALNSLENMSRPQKIGIIAPDMDIPTIDGYVDTSRSPNLFALLGQDYLLQKISPQTVQIGVEINTLIVVSPAEELSRLPRYALDQFLLRGGNLILLTDSLNEQNGKIIPGEGLNQLLAPLGLSYSDKEVIGDAQNAEETVVNNQARLYYPWINIKERALEGQPLTAGLKNLIFRSPAAVKIAEKIPEDIRITPLITTSSRGGHVSSFRASRLDKDLILQNYTEDNHPYLLAVLAEGKFRSGFDKNILEGTKLQKQMLDYLPASIKPFKLLLIADTDFAYDANWSDNSFKKDNPVYGYVPWADNGELIKRAVDAFNGRTNLADLSPSPMFGASSLSDIFREEISSLYDDQRQTILLRLEKMVRERLSLAASYAGRSPDFSEIKRQNLLEHDIAEAEHEIRRLDFIINSAYDKQINIFIIITAAVSLLFMLMLIAVLRHCRRKIRE